MPSFKEMVEKYKKRRHDTVVDAVTTGLSLADNVTVDLGLLEDTGVATEIAETVSNVLPFAVIAVTEQCKVLLGKKTRRCRGGGRCLPHGQDRRGHGRGRGGYGCRGGCCGGAACGGQRTGDYGSLSRPCPDGAPRQPAYPAPQGAQYRAAQPHKCGGISHAAAIS